ncbi:MAG: hypothetical protein QW041_03370 [Candidatus Pacearchaeota archaeon]
MLRECLSAILILSFVNCTYAGEKRYFNSKGSYIINEKKINGKSNYELEKIIDNEKNKINKIKLKELNYLDSLYTFTYFDWKKAANIVHSYAKQGKIKKNDIDLCIRALRRASFMNFYSRKTIPPIDPRLALLIDIIESNIKGNSKGIHGEIGEMQIMPYVFEKYKNYYIKNPYWIEGKGIENSINNIIMGMDRIAAGVSTINCKGKMLDEMTSQELIKLYSFYSRNKLYFDENDNAPLRNLAYELKNHAYLLNYVFNISQSYDFKTNKGRKLFAKEAAKKQPKVARKSNGNKKFD